MMNMVETVAKAMWEQRRKHANVSHIELEEWGDGAIPCANGIMEEAMAAIEAMRKPADEEWRPYFAWRPIEVGDKLYGGTHWVWLEWLERRKPGVWEGAHVWSRWTYRHPPKEAISVEGGVDGHLWTDGRLGKRKG